MITRMPFAVAISVIDRTLSRTSASVPGVNRLAMSLVPPSMITAFGWSATTSCRNRMSICAVVWPAMPRLRYGLPGKKRPSERLHASLVCTPKNTTRSAPAAGFGSSAFSLPYRVRPAQSRSRRAYALSLFSSSAADNPDEVWANSAEAAIATRTTATQTATRLTAIGNLSDAPAARKAKRGHGDRFAMRNVNETRLQVAHRRRRRAVCEYGSSARPVGRDRDREWRFRDAIRAQPTPWPLAERSRDR